MDKSKERGRTCLSDILLWFRCLNLLLLLCLIHCIGSAPAGNTPRPVMGEKGGNATLPCEFEARDIIDIILNRRSKPILVCQNEECKSENDRLFKKGSCDVTIKDLIFDDAGTYILSVHYTDDQRKREYHLHIHDEISGKTGEQLKMNILLANAEKVETNSSGEWTEVWTRGHGVSSDRLTDRDGNLTISNFTVSDTGTYRVLDYEGEILITVTVTGSSSGTKGKLDTDDDDDDDKPNKLYTVESWIIVVSVIGALLVLVISALIWKYKCQHRNTGHESVPMEDIIQQSRRSRDDTD